MESRWLDTIECVQKLMEWGINITDTDNPKWLIKMTVTTVGYCEKGLIRIKNRGSTWWVHISRKLDGHDTDYLINSLRKWGFARHTVLQSKYVYGAVQPKRQIGTAVRMLKKSIGMLDSVGVYNRTVAVFDDPIVLYSGDTLKIDHEVTMSDA